MIWKSAYPRLHVNQDELSLQDATEQYPGSEPILTEAWKLFKQTVSGVGNVETPCTDYPAEQFSDKLGNSDQIANRAKS